MTRSLWMTVVTAIVALAAMAAVAHGAEEVTRESFVAQAEPICERNTRLVQGILEGAKEKVDDGRLPPAGRQFARAAAAFESTIQQISAIPRPPADDARLLKWLKFLRIVQAHLANIGKALKERDQIRAEHESIRAEQSSNAANNVGFVFGFHNCRLSRSQFR